MITSIPSCSWRMTRPCSSRIVVQADDPVRLYRRGEPLDGDGAGLLGEHGVLDQRVGLVREEDASEVGVRLQPRGQIHLVADDRVVDAIVAAEVADRAKAGVDPDPQLEDVLLAALPPLGLQIPHPLLHGDRHLDAGRRVVARAARFRIAEEQHDGVADELVDGRPVLEGDRRHLAQVLVEQARQLLRFQEVRGFREARDVREEDRQLLALRCDLDALLAAEDRPVQLRRKVFRQLR